MEAGCSRHVGAERVSVGSRRSILRLAGAFVLTLNACAAIPTPTPPSTASTSLSEEATPPPPTVGPTPKPTVTASPGWHLVPGQPPTPQGAVATLDDIAPGGPGFVAVGSVSSGSATTAAIWTSHD